ncbi:MAG: hypothetical protein WC683_04805 [bacterium]
MSVPAPVKEEKQPSTPRGRHIYSAEILRLEIISRLMEGRADLQRISREQKDVEAAHDAFAEKGIHLPGCKRYIVSNRELSPAIDGMREDFLARVLPLQPAFGTIASPAGEPKPGILDAIIGLVTGNKGESK